MHRMPFAVLAVAAAVLGTPATARADSGQLADFSLELTSAAPASPTGMNVHVAFHTAGRPDAKSPPVRPAFCRAPAGTVFDSSALPRCAASDEQLHLLG